MKERRKKELLKILVLLIVASLALLFVDPGMRASPYNEF